MVTPCLRAGASYGTVMSAICRTPPTTRFDIGHDTKLRLGSINTTSSDWPENSRTYLAAVAPP